MTIAGALAITGGILTVAAIVLGIIAADSRGRTARQVASIGWTVFALSIGCLIAAVWTHALT